MKLKRGRRAQEVRRREARRVEHKGDGQRRAALAGALVLCGSFAIATVPVYAAGLPKPCPAGGTACGGASWDGLSTGSTLSSALNRLIINQATNSAIFNWQSFNISTGETVQFIQPSNSSVALNRIFDPNVSTISGNLLANGQIYLVNPNGILFGSGANVNVGGLIASTSNITDQRITKGLLSDTNVFDPVFTENASFVGGALEPSAGANPSIVVQPGATLYAAGRNTAGTVVSAGRVFLFAPTVENGGSIRVDGGGQVILAAGSDIYLGVSGDPSLRGLLVEVGGTSNSVTVDKSGVISDSHGNITLMGLAVNQNGNVSATSALDANGSIRLIARTADPSDTIFTPVNTDAADALMAIAQTGAVELGSGSQTTVRLDPTDTATQPIADSTAASLRSTIYIQGSSVRIGGNGAPGTTLVQANGGVVTVSARQASSGVALVGSGQPAAYQIGDGGLLGASDPASTINVGSDAVIDVSGLQNVVVPGDAYFAYISRLTSTNLANAPYQRTGFLLGQGLYVDLLTAPSWLNVASLLANVSSTQAQRNTAGGTISLLAEGSVNLAKGSVLNVSGGSSDVTAAVGRTSQLITATGSVVNISNASPDAQYVGFADQGSTTFVDPLEGINQTSSWQVPFYQQVPAFVQGANAGTVQIYAPTATLSGTLLANTVTAQQQRTSPPLGGLLQIGSSDPTLLDFQAGFSRADIVLGTLDAQLNQQAAAAGQPAPIVVDTSALLSGGFTRLDLTSDGEIELRAGNPLNLGPNGQFTARANQIEVDSSITTPGGSISLSQRPLTAFDVISANGNSSDNAATDDTVMRQTLSLVDSNSAQFGAVHFATGTSLSVAGTWTNDYVSPSPNYSSPIVLNGGSISVSGANVDVSGARFDVSAGAWYTVAGSFSGGAGGSLSITATNRNPLAPPELFYGGNLTQTADTGVLELGSDFAARISGFGVGGGGSLSIAAPYLALGSAPAGYVGVDPAVGADGFASFKFSGYEGLLMPSGTVFQPTVASLINTAALDASASTGSLRSLATLQSPLPGQLAPAKISLAASAAADGTVSVGAGAVVDAGAGGSISVSGGADIQDDGVLRAQGGSVSLTLGLAGGADAFASGQIETRAIVLGAQSLIDVSGVSLATLQANGERTGNVLSGGKVDVDATLGTVAMYPGARIQAQGAADTVDEVSTGSTLVAQTVASAGGTVEFSASNAMYIEGSIEARGGNATADGGSLAVNFYAPSQPGGLVSWFPQGPETLTVTAVLPALAPGQSSFNDGALNFAAYVAPQAIDTHSSGFASVWLQSPNTIAFVPSTAGGSVSLSVSNSLVLSSSALSAPAGASVNLSAPIVMLGPVAQLSPVVASTDTQVFSNVTTAYAAIGGSAGLNVSAGNQLDLVGNLYLQGFGNSTLASQADIQAIGILPPSAGSANLLTRAPGSLNFGGNLLLSAAQVYPSTQTDYVFAAVAPSSDLANGKLQVQVAPGSASPAAPLSADGTLTFDVNDFASSGRVVAPQGAIAIDAARSVDLEAGSLLSVAGSGLVPFGTVTGGTVWTYGMPANNTTLPVQSYTIATSSGGEVAGSLAGKGIAIAAPSVDAKPGSLIDIAAGGDTLGDGFIAGPGGSYDMSLNFPYVSTAPTQRNPFFALVPTYRNGTGPFDAQIFSDLVLNAAAPGASTAAFQIGETITIGPGSALPAGTYTVLPSRYALLPGAYAVEAASGYSSMIAGTSVNLPDGSAVVAGQLGYATAGTMASSLWSGYRVFTDTQFRTFSEFQDFTGAATLAAWAVDSGTTALRSGADAGAFSLDATGLVRFGSSIDAQAGASGSGADLSFDAPAIVVGKGLPQPAVPESTLALDSSMLSGLDAQTIVIGATEQRSGTSLTIGSATSSVTVQGSATLNAGEIVLLGSAIDVAPGANLGAKSSLGANTTAVTVDGNGAGLYVGPSAVLPTWPGNGGNTGNGSLTVGAGATIAGGGVLFDASNGLSLAQGAQIQTGSIGFNASQVNVGGSAPAGLPGLTLSDSLLGSLSNLARLTLESPGGLNVYGNVQIGAVGAGGTAALGDLDVVGPGIFGFGASGSTATIVAGHVQLDNSGGSAAPAASGRGSLVIDTLAGAQADGSVSVSGAVSIGGFAAGTTIAATGRAASSSQSAAGTGELLFTGLAGQSASIDLVDAGATLSISSTRIAAQSGVQAAITVPGALTVLASGAAQAPETTELGAQLAIQAQSVNFGGRIDLPAGTVTIDTTGAGSAGGIELATGSSIRVAGVTQSFASATADVSAGSISLSSASGGIQQASGSVLDISGSGTLGDAGTLILSASAGTIELQGTLAATPGSAARGADVSIDAGTLGNFSALAATIGAGTGAGGANAITMRARNGNITVAAGDELQAASITLEADGGQRATDGSIFVQGTLDASGSNGGSIGLFANNQTVLAGSARLIATATTTGGSGGSVEISSRVTASAAAPTTLDAIVLDAGASIDVSGGSAGGGGTILLRANAFLPTSSAADVEVAQLPANSLVGASTAIVEGVYVDAYSSSVTLDANLAATESARLAAYMAAMGSNNVQARLDPNGAVSGPGGVPGTISLRPGLEIQSQGDITVSDPIDFAAGLSDPVSGAGSFTWRYGGSTLATSVPGEFTLRAAGDLIINASISDGFTPTAPGAALTSTVSSSGQSWSYTLTAGADLSSSNPNQVLANAAAASAQRSGQTGGDLLIGVASSVTTAPMPVTIRTGTGSITLNASEDVVLGSGSGNDSVASDAVYSAGVADVSGVTLPALALPGFGIRTTAFPYQLTQGGGNVAIAAGGDVLGPNGGGSTQAPDTWLMYGGGGTTSDPTLWFVDFAQFQQGFGALGGGNLAIAAGRNVAVGAVVPSLGVAANGSLTEWNAGSLQVAAGGALQQGFYYDEAGTFQVRATSIGLPLTNAGEVVFAQGSNALSIQAQEGANIGMSADVFAATSSSATVNKLLVMPARTAFASSFYTYSDTTDLNVRVASGDLSLNLPGYTLVATLTPSVQLTAFGGSVVSNTGNGALTMYPSAVGQLSILSNGSLENLGIQMSQSDPSLGPTLFAPYTPTDQTLKAGTWMTATADIFIGNDGATLHANDPDPAMIVSRTGSLDSGTYIIPKTTEIIVAGDIESPVITIQNSTAKSLSTVSAGGQIDDSSGQNAQIFIGGAGAAQIVSGGAMNLGIDGPGIVSRGNFDNPNLPAIGATLIVGAGTGRAASGFAALPDYTGMIDNFVKFNVFASSGSASSGLNAQVLAALSSDPSLAPLVNALKVGLADRASATNSSSAFNQAIAALDPVTLADGAVKLAAAVQVVANAQFVGSSNSDTFAAAYAVFGDLFPALNNNAAAIRQFVLDNPFANAPNGSDLRQQALQGLPAALTAAINLGLADPASVNQPGSAFSQALAALPSTSLSSGGRELLANVLQVAGTSLDALAAAGQLTGSGTPYAKGLTAFASAYSPTTPAGLNDLNMAYNQINVQQTGNVAIFTPQGGVIVGQSSPPALDTTAEGKTPADLGIFTYGGGDIIGMARDSFNVFESRVFTVDGGDIDLWSSLQNIDAGRGARDVAVVPPPTVITNSNGIQTLSLGAAVSGSGIGALETEPDQPPSNINLMAPNGYVDAGEAGIRAQTGKVVLGTNLVLNGNNIQAASGVSGGAVVATPPPPAPPSTGTSSGDRAVADAQREAVAQQQAAAQAAADQRRFVVTGEFVGFVSSDSDDGDSDDKKRKKGNDARP